jgi:chromosome segregation ATPase
MATKGSKRTTNAKTASPGKKQKTEVESPFVDIIATLQGADHLPERCREMLVNMVAPSLNTAQSERHALQTLGVTMIEETMLGAKEKLVQAIDQAQKELSELEGSRESLVSCVSETEAAHTSKTSTEQAKQSALDEAKKAVADAGDALADAKEAERKGEEPLTNLRQEKVTLESLLQDHFKTPMEADEGPHYAELKPHIPKLGLDESLAIALPSSAAKKKDQRGGFDTVVLTELEKALIAQIETITKGIAEEEPKMAERKAAVHTAETTLDQKMTTEKAASVELEAAQAAREASALELSKAKDGVATFAPRVEEATIKHSELVLKLKNFETGPFATFLTFRDKAAVAAVEGEAASAGA